MHQPAIPDNVKPFLKWAGGKQQLLLHIERAIPKLCHSGEPFVYLEPFVGSGAVLFWMLKNFPNIEKAVINDINPTLINTYKVVRDHVQSLIEELSQLEQAYFSHNENQRKECYLSKRAEFNTFTASSVRQAALMIFLNRTCYNGLYRVNSKNLFNVPFGKYKNPKICREALLRSDSAALQKVEILSGDYLKTLGHASGDAFFYLDPPYKPISQTASFNAYSKEVFADREQIRLKTFCDTLHKKKCRWLLSNSDPKNIDPENGFFDDLYADYSIKRVKARRNINSKGNKRGAINELLIANYPLMIEREEIEGEG